MTSDRIVNDADTGSFLWPLLQDEGGNNNSGAIGRCLE
jgi:hypothetical protein